ncbi:MAG: hypothetical protein LUO79_08375, partial [Methanomassiliicoccales archaeon]|nr:hypothetical protein [Methanomassiliicoccales archaeon]
MQSQDRRFSLTAIQVQEPPFELYRRLSGEFDRSFMLESAVGDQRTVAYSFLGFGPEMEYTCTDGVVDGGEGHDDLRDRPLEFLRAVIRD